MFLSNVDVNSDEGFLISNAKAFLHSKPFRSKAWMLTAKTLFPDNFNIQFEVYLIEKNAGNVQEAAKCFSMLFKHFPTESSLWDEMYILTDALQSDSATAEAIFLQNMFSSIPEDIQHDILTATSEKTDDKMEHCKLVLLMLKRCPHSSPQLAIRLVDTLINSERMEHCKSAVNCYRKVLVCDVLPLILDSKGELSIKTLSRWLHKTVEFYATYLLNPSSTDNSLTKEEIEKLTWDNFFSLLVKFGAKLDWKLFSTFSQPWKKDATWQQIRSYFLTYRTAGEELASEKQLVYYVTIYIAYAIQQYTALLFPADAAKPALVLVEAFVKSDQNQGEVACKKMKYEHHLSENDPNQPSVTVGQGSRDVYRYFTFVVKCWDLLHSRETLIKEFKKLQQNISLDSSQFLTDMALYRGAAINLTSEIEAAGTNLRLVLQCISCNYLCGKFYALWDCCVPVIKLLDSLSVEGEFSNDLMASAGLRHVHYLPLARLPLLQYIVKIMLFTLMNSLMNTHADTNLIYGKLFILSQLNWPAEQQLVKDLLDRIRERGSFSFHPFFTYIVNADILEEFMFLYSDSRVTSLDILPHTKDPISSQRRTRGVDRGAREEFRLAMRQQMSRTNESIPNLIQKFLLSEERVRSRRSSNMA